MSKPEVNEYEFIQLMNDKMRDHRMYEEGMLVEPKPTNSDKFLGYKIFGGIHTRTVVAWAENQINKKYELIIKS